MLMTLLYLARFLVVVGVAAVGVDIDEAAAFGPVLPGDLAHFCSISWLSKGFAGDMKIVVKVGMNLKVGNGMGVFYHRK